MLAKQLKLEHEAHKRELNRLMKGGRANNVMMYASQTPVKKSKPLVNRTGHKRGPSMASSPNPKELVQSPLVKAGIS